MRHHAMDREHRLMSHVDHTCLMSCALRSQHSATTDSHVRRQTQLTGCAVSADRRKCGVSQVLLWKHGRRRVDVSVR
eukprot:921034-Prymnesium_polylepis.2